MAAVRDTIEVYFFAAIVFAFALASYSRNLAWRYDTGLWESVVAASPFRARPHNNLGMAYEKAGMGQAAFSEYASAVRLNPRYPPARSNLAEMYYIRGMLAEAEGELLKAIALSSPYEDLHRRLGYVYLRAGRAEEAGREFEKAVMLIPDHRDARREAALAYAAEAYSYTDRGDFRRALVLHGIASSVDPAFPDARYGLAQAYEALGRREDAVLQFKEYMRLALPDDPFRAEALRHIERLRR
ncbi:MAG: tetratricopeptide repeat protein [Deltaproteobacteria bacterium]|nr:tetratricopeptide repeat protein [Deltaproteobacteria bacterium]